MLQQCHFNLTTALSGGQESTAIFASPFSFPLPPSLALPWLCGSLMPRIWESLPSLLSQHLSQQEQTELGAPAGNSELGIQPRSPGLEKVLATPGTVISWAWRPSLAGKRCPQLLRDSRPLSEGFSLSDPTDLCQSLLDSVRSSAQPPKEGGVTA